MLGVQPKPQRCHLCPSRRRQATARQVVTVVSCLSLACMVLVNFQVASLLRRTTPGRTAGTLVGCVAGFAVFVQSSFYVGAWTPPANQVSSQIDANIAKYANNPYADTEAPSTKPAAPELDIPKLPSRLDAVIPVEPAVEKPAPAVIFDGSN